ncbi:MAG: T9SS type A sorting domain-containing protein [Bacteroidales bacterium]|nr:T9SS type A sorting domain-containing protein [Bacteroidales bacterium]
MKQTFSIKKLLIFFVICSFYHIATAQNQQQINNAGFEQWEGSDDFIEPVQWSSFMHTECSNPYYLNLLRHRQIEPSTSVRPGSDGTSSARIFARDASMMGYTIIANGNVTTGRVFAQDVNLDQAGNKTKREETGFNHPFTAHPDSVTFWVRNNCIDVAQLSYMKAIIHDNTDYFIPLSGLNDYDHAVGVATATFHNEGNIWVRQSVPFDYDTYQATDPQYMLMFFNTNVEAAVGNPSDELFIDDIFLIYQPAVSVNTITPTNFLVNASSGAAISIPFTLTGTMSPDNLNAPANEVIAQLSDATGNFDNPIILGSLTTNESGVINGTIPAGTPVGNGYRVRIVTTNYPMISADNGIDLSITYPACTVTVSALPTNGGIVTGGGTFDYGTEITVEAAANEGFLFVNWLNNGVQISIQENYTFIVTENIELVANFSEIGNYSVTVSASPIEAGTVSGAGNYSEGSNVTVSTIPNEGYTFLYWTQNDQQISTETTYSFTITDHCNMIAHYSINTYEITVTADPPIGGTVFGGGTFPFGSEITVHATAYPNYTFSGWTFNNETLSLEEDFTLTVTENMPLIGHFELKSSISEIENTSFRAYSSRQKIIIESTQSGEAYLYNLQGQLVQKMMVSQGKSTISVSESGVYFLRLKAQIQKIIVTF